MPSVTTAEDPNDRHERGRANGPTCGLFAVARSYPLRDSRNGCELPFSGDDWKTVMTCVDRITGRLSVRYCLRLDPTDPWGYEELLTALSRKG